MRQDHALAHDRAGPPVPELRLGGASPAAATEGVGPRQAAGRLRRTPQDAGLEGVAEGHLRRRGAAPCAAGHRQRPARRVQEGGGFPGRPALPPPPAPARFEGGRRPRWPRTGGGTGAVAARWRVPGAVSARFGALVRTLATFPCEHHSARGPARSLRRARHRVHRDAHRAAAAPRRQPALRGFACPRSAEEPQHRAALA